MTVTSEFQGTHLFDRVCWAKKNLEPHQTKYAVVYEDVDMDCCAVMHPDPNAMAGFIGNWKRMKPSLISNGTPEVICCTKRPVKVRKQKKKRCSI